MTPDASSSKHITTVSQITSSITTQTTTTTMSTTTKPTTINVESTFPSTLTTRFFSSINKNTSTGIASIASNFDEKICDSHSNCYYPKDLIQNGFKFFNINYLP